MIPEPEHHFFTAALECRFLLHVPEASSADRLLVLTLHGYGSNPEAMLRLTIPTVGPEHIVAAIQAPFQHYLSPTPGPGATGYNWGVRDHHAAATRLHHEMVRTVLDRLSDQFSIGSRRCVLMGFSQAVGLNYRFAGTFPDQVGGVIGLCGGVPRDWDEEKYRPIEAPILHISRETDEFFPVATVEKFPERLRRHAADVEFHLIPGTHRYPSKAVSIVKPWLRRVFGGGAR